MSSNDQGSAEHLDDQGQEGGGQKPQHTLPELLVERKLSGEEMGKEAAKRAPVIIIAVMIHVIVGAIMGLMYFKKTKKDEENVRVQVSQSSSDTPKIEEKPPEPEKPLELTAIPEVEATDISEVTEEFNTAVDDTVNPFATDSSQKFGMSEGTDDAPDNLLTMSSGGKGLAGAIGVGAGSGPGGGIRRGSPLGGSRIGRRNSQKTQLEMTEKVVQAGLEWLKNHQSPDGSWDPVGFAACCKGGERCEGRGNPAHIAGVTGLALLTFLGAGLDPTQTGPYAECIKNGLKWLRKNQDAEGCFGPRHDHRFTYAHACATIAMCEAYGATKHTAWKKSAQDALDFAAACQNPYAGWRYGKKPGDNDSSVTGWMIMALKSGKDCGLAVSDTVLKQGVDYVNSMTDADSGRTGYTKTGEYAVRPEGLQDKFPATETESLTAVAMCSRIFADTADRDAELMRKGQELLIKRLPVWEEKTGKIDMYYWYYGTLAMFQMGGTAWDSWNRNLKSVVIDHQQQNGCQKGSWDPKDPWAEDGGRVYSTCLMTLCLEVYYRYPRVFGVKKK